MSKQLTAILLGLILLTFGGLVLVSNIISERKPAGEAGAATPLLTMTPKLKQAANIRESLSKDEINADLKRAAMQLQEIIEVAKANDWQKARGIYDNFTLKNKRLPLPELNEPHISPLWQDYFDFYHVQFERALQEKQAKALVVAGQQMRGIISESLARVSGSATPMEVERLHFLISELILWKDLGDEKMVQVRKIALTEAWADVDSLLRTKRGSESISLAISGQISKIIGAENLASLSEALPELEAQIAKLEAFYPSKSTNP